MPPIDRASRLPADPRLDCEQPPPLVLQSPALVGAGHLSLLVLCAACLLVPSNDGRLRPAAAGGAVLQRPDDAVRADVGHLLGLNIFFMPGL